MTETTKSTWLPVARIEELIPGKPKIISMNGTRIAIFKLEGNEVCAIEDVCTHDDGPVAEGKVEGCVIECPRHGARFDIKTGAVLAMPAVVPIRTFPVRLSGSHIEIEVTE